MPQLHLPVFPDGTSDINGVLSFEKRDGVVTYFHGLSPVFAHDETDLKTFRMITSQFWVNSMVTQMQIVEAFGVPLRTVKRYCGLYKEKGPAGFYGPRAGRGPAVLISEVVQRAQQLLDNGVQPNDVADELGVKRDTLRKAIRAGRLHAKKKLTRVQNQRDAKRK